MQKINLIDLMPLSLQEDSTIKAICDVLDPHIGRMWEDVDYISIYRNIDMYSHDILDQLAYQFHVDFYKDDMDLETKRNLIKKSIRYHRIKGTPAAVEELLTEVFGDSWLEEWFEYAGEPYFFKVYTTNLFIDANKMKMFFEALDSVKNTRSWLEAFLLVIREKIVYRDKINSYKINFWVTNQIPSGRVPTQSYRGLRYRDVITLDSGGRVSNNRGYKANDIISGETPLKGGK